MDPQKCEPPKMYEGGRNWTKLFYKKCSSSKVRKTKINFLFFYFFVGASPKLFGRFLGDCSADSWVIFSAGAGAIFRPILGRFFGRRLGNFLACAGAIFLPALGGFFGRALSDFLVGAKSRRRTIFPLLLNSSRRKIPPPPHRKTPLLENSPTPAA